MKIVKSLEKFGLSLTSFREAIENKANKMVDFLACYYVH